MKPIKLRKLLSTDKKLFSSVDALCEPHIMESVIDINRAAKSLTC